MAERRAVVIGAGVGGLSAALTLASAGLRVTVLEAADAPGGKAGTVLLEGAEADTGPSVLTLPDVFDALFRRAGTSLADEVRLLRPDPATRYRWPDGTVLDVHQEVDATLASTRAALGAEAEADLAGFLAYAGGLWAVAAPRFVYGPAPALGAMLSLGALRDLVAIDPFSTMAGAIRRRVRSPHIRDVLLRFATYAGSDPRRAPATLGCITHVEMALGGYGVAGGIGALVRAMVRVAERQGVELRLGEPVEQVLVSAGRATGVRTPRGELPAEVVVSNAEVAHLHADLLGRKAPAAPTSTSGWNAIVRAAVADRAAHTVLFPATYGDEFVDLFDRRRVPRDPALYVCAQRLAHAREGWPGEEPLFLMVNAPPVGAGEEPDAEALEATSMRRLREAGLVDAGARVLWRRTPRGLAERFPRSQGALYGAAHDGPTAALFRPSNRVSGVGGLFVASGTAHPGGGLPLVALSGRAAANEALRDLGLPGAA